MQRSCPSLSLVQCIGRKCNLRDILISNIYTKFELSADCLVSQCRCTDWPVFELGVVPFTVHINVQAGLALNSGSVHLQQMYSLVTLCSLKVSQFTAHIQAGLHGTDLKGQSVLRTVTCGISFLIHIGTSQQGSH